MDESILNLKSLIKKLREVVQILFTKKLNGQDIYIYGILYRSESLVNGFLGLAENNNFICAISLIRLQLDSLLRIYAPTISELDFEKFANTVIYDGAEIRSMNSKFKNTKNDNYKLTDSFLSLKISEEQGFEWVYKSYKNMNSFVHFSNKHVFASISTANNGMAKFVLGEQDFIPELEKVKAVNLMYNITLGILFLSELYLEERKQQ